VGNFVYNYFMDSIFKSLVVDIFTLDATGPIKSDISLVDKLGL